MPAPQYRSCGHCISRSPCRGRGFKSNPARAALIKLALCVAAILAFYCNGLFLRVGRRVKGGKSITDNEHGESSSCLVLGRCMGGGWWIARRGGDGYSATADTSTRDQTLHCSFNLFVTGYTICISHVIRSSLLLPAYQHRPISITHTTHRYIYTTSGRNKLLQGRGSSQRSPFGVESTHSRRSNQFCWPLYFHGLDPGAKCPEAQNGEYQGTECLAGRRGSQGGGDAGGRGASPTTTPHISANSVNVDVHRDWGW